MLPKHITKFALLLIVPVLLLGTRLLAQTDTTAADPKIIALLEQVSRENLQQHVQKLAEAGGHQSRVSYTEGNLWAVQYIHEVFASFPGLTLVVVDTFFAANATAAYDTVPLMNVVATLEGKTTPEQSYIIGGHLDATANRDGGLDWEADWATAKAPGADDNATGVAAILEIARILSDPANDFQNDFTIQFVAFGAEERHPAYDDHNHQGSRHFATEAFNRKDDILGAYILDMIGYNGTGTVTCDVVSNSESEELGLALLQANTDYGLGLEMNEPPFPEATYSDHDWFWLYRYKAVLLIENAPPWNSDPPRYTANPYYHKQSDEPGTVDYAQVEKVAQLALATVASLATPVTSVASPEPASPESFLLHQNHPNPFNAGTQIRYQLPNRTRVRLSVYNLRGQRVATLVDGVQSAGAHTVAWDGRDAGGEDLPSGIYLYVLTAGDRRVARKLVLLK